MKNNGDRVENLTLLVEDAIGQLRSLHHDGREITALPPLPLPLAQPA